MLCGQLFLPPECQALFPAPHAVAYIKACVPEQVEELRRALAVGLVPTEEHDVNIGMRVQLSPAIPADCEECRHGAGRRQKIVRLAKGPVDESGTPLHNLVARRACKVRLLDDGVLFFEIRLKTDVKR